MECAAQVGGEGGVLRNGKKVQYPVNDHAKGNGPQLTGAGGWRGVA